MLICYFLPYVISGENAHILVHDNLDANVGWIKVLLDNHGVFARPDSTIDQVMNGLPRSSFPGYDISTLWFHFFGMYWGYVTNKFLMSLVAFFGMLFLLQRFVLPAKANTFVAFGVALIFSILPFWSFTMSVAGLPLVSFALLNLRSQRKHYSNVLILLIYAFYSSLILTGFFLFIVIGIVFIVDVIKSKKINLTFIFGTILLGVGYLVSHFPIIYTILFVKGYISHRVEFVDPGVTFQSAISQGVRLFLFGQYHAHSLHTFILIPITTGLVAMSLHKKINKIHLILIAFIVATSCLYGMLVWQNLSALKEQIMSVFPIQLQRFHFLQPLIWYVLFAMTLAYLAAFNKIGKIFTGIALIIQVGYVGFHHETIVNRNGPSFAQFFAVDQFAEIKKHIQDPLSSFRIVSLGMHPSIAQYNGFYALDGYFADYPLKYKHQFRKIIAGELNKDSTLCNYFDHWGSRCYAYSAEIGSDLPLRKYAHNTDRNFDINRLDFDFDMFESMGGKFILANASIDTTQNKKLHLDGVFDDQNSFWKIYLYSIH